MKKHLEEGDLEGSSDQGLFLDRREGRKERRKKLTQEEGAPSEIPLPQGERSQLKDRHPKEGDFPRNNHREREDLLQDSHQEEEDLLQDSHREEEDLLQGNHQEEEDLR